MKININKYKLINVIDRIILIKIPKLIIEELIPTFFYQCISKSRGKY